MKMTKDRTTKMGSARKIAVIPMMIA